MTPKEKAKELFKKIYLSDGKVWQETAKQCCLMVVDEIVELQKFDFGFDSNYWKEVKQEINNI
jgi:hypothetical protein